MTWLHSCAQEQKMWIFITARQSFGARPYGSGSADVCIPPPLSSILQLLRKAAVKWGAECSVGNLARIFSDTCPLACGKLTPDFCCVGLEDYTVGWERYRMRELLCGKHKLSGGLGKGSDSHSCLDSWQPQGERDTWHQSTLWRSVGFLGDSLREMRLCQRAPERACAAVRHASRKPQATAHRPTGVTQTWCSCTLISTTSPLTDRT